MKRFLLVAAFFAGCFWAHAASAATCSVPNQLQNGQYVDANGLMQNFNALITCGNSVDNSQIGVLGLYASQIIPLTGAQATFGGTVNFTFPTQVKAATFVSSMYPTANYAWTDNATHVTASIGTNTCTTSGIQGTVFALVDGASCLLNVDASGNLGLLHNLGVANSLSVTGAATFASTITDSSLTASKAVCTNGSKTLVSTCGYYSFVLTENDGGGCLTHTICAYTTTGYPANGPTACTIAANAYTGAATDLYDSLLSLYYNSANTRFEYVWFNAGSATIASGDTLTVAGFCE